ncbi:hypothetical protein NBRC116583_37380 [Arenicella sp. 4NH20-0111]|uniref:spermidine synthase n=1 Tax=Arenicella sp. 4NH20-0111 TaxID=3127648 RepID=UPI0031029C44
MEHVFEELDYQKTEFGEISLRRRSEPRLDHKIIYEVKLGEEFLMSSLFVEAEEQLSMLGLARLKQNGYHDGLRIVVGGLGLGYTAITALADRAVTELRTIDVMLPVINWHQKGMLPVGDILARDPKSSLVHGDFFAIATDNKKGFLNDEQVHALFLDIDHSPSHWLKDSNHSFYAKDSLTTVSRKIVAGGVFALWSNDWPDDRFVSLLDSVFHETHAHVVRFDNPYSGGESINTIYVASVL